MQTKAVELSFSRLFRRARGLAVLWTAKRDEAQALAHRLGSAFSGVAVHVPRLFPALGTDAEPGAMGSVAREA